MKSLRIQIMSGAVFLVALGWVLVAWIPARGQEAPSGEPAVVPSGAAASPMVTVEHHGRLLVLNYGPKPGSGGLMANPGPRGEPPGFVIYKGPRPIASGSFEFG